MAEYIEREAGCRKCFHYDACFYHITEETKLLTVNECPLFVNKADVVEVQHSEWKDNYNGTFTCSVCGGQSPKMGWCGRCGAKMDGNGEGE